MSSALLKYANKKVAKPTAVVIEAEAPAPAWAAASASAASAEPSTTGFKVADVSSEQVALTEEEELKQKREQDAVKAKFHSARAGLKAEASPASGIADAPAPATAPAPAPAPAPTGWRSRTVAAAQVGTTSSATTSAPVTANVAPGGKSSWREREAAKLAAGPSASASTSSWSKPVAAPVMSEESFPTLGGPASAAPKPVKASAWGSVAAVKPSAAAVVASTIVKAAPAPQSTPKAPEAAPAPVDTQLGVLFEKLTLNSRLELSATQYNAKIDEAIKGAIDSESTTALIATLRTIGGSRHQLTEAVVRLLWLGLDSDASQQAFVDTALVELLDAKVVGRDNVANGIWEVVADMDSLLLDVPKAVSYLAVMLKSVVLRKVYPTARLPEKVAAALGVTIDPSTDPEDIVIDEEEYYEDEDEEDYEDYDAEDDEELQRELGIANKNMKAKNKHMKKDDF